MRTVIPVSYYFLCLNILFVLTLILPKSTFAASPPSLPLPACVVVDGEEVGACAEKDFRVSGSISGEFAAGATLTINTKPNIPVCDYHNASKLSWPWTPSPCYASVDVPSISRCAVIDMSDGNTFREMNCAQALYRNSFGVSQLFSLQNKSGSRCGGAGDFRTYFYGGPANVPGARWSEAGPTKLDCEVTFNGERPDGLLGPTWVIVSVGVDVAETGDERFARRHAETKFYVPIDGDARPFIDAEFESDVFGLKAVFTNLSNASPDKTLSYSWRFGDGNTSNLKNPTHVYEEPGRYNITLEAKDQDNIYSTEYQTITVEGGLIVDISGPNMIENTQTVSFSVRVGNFDGSDISGFELDISDSEGLLEVQGIPKPAVLMSIPNGESFTAQYQIKAIGTGETVLLAKGSGTNNNGETVQADDEHELAIQPSLSLSLDAPAVRASGDDVTIMLSITNNEDSVIEGIKVESLLTLPNELVEYISGPTDLNGLDPRINPLSLESGESTMVTWLYTTKGQGVVDMEAFVAFDSIVSESRALTSVKGKFAIDIAALELRELRLQPERPIPGSFSFIRGTIKNIGNIDISDIDFEIADSAPEVKHIERVIKNLSPEVSPRIALLKEGESHEFIIPVGMLLDVGSATSYTLPLSFAGTVTLEDETIEVDVTETLKDDLDRSLYWVDIKDEFFSLLVNGFVSAINEVDTFAEGSLIGGITIGTAEGVISALQKIGDGGLRAVDFIGETVGDQGETLTKEGRQIVNLITEYNNTTSFEQKLVDLAEVEESITVAGVDIFASWMFDVETATREGRTRDVASLISEPAANLVGSIGAEQAGAKLFAKFLRTGVGRKLLSKFRKKGDVPDEDSSVTTVQNYLDKQKQTFDELPEGVPLTGTQALSAGVEGDDLAFMIRKAKETNTTFFVRPRPATAAKWAAARFNAKPLPIKLKSVNEIDHKWLGYNEADTGLVVIREPDSPVDKLRDAIANGEFDIDTDQAEINAILNRYSAKKAEFESSAELLTKLNTVKTHRIVKDPDPGNPDLDLVEEVEQAGISVKRYGRDVVTTVSVEPGTGRLIFDYNNKPVYSDIDLLSVAKRDGSNISPTLHEEILRESSYGFDGQHHATAQTSDFPKAEFAQKTAAQYLAEHSRGGEGLLIIGPEHTTKGFVESFDLISLAEAKALDAGEIKLSGYDLYGLVVKSVTYTGVQTR